MKIEQGRQDAVGGDFEQGAKAKVRSTEPGGTIENTIIALDHTAYRIGSIGVVEWKNRREGSGRPHPENRSCCVAPAIDCGPIKISIFAERQSVLRKGPVGAVERDQSCESSIRGYAEHGAEIIETLHG